LRGAAKFCRQIARAAPRQRALPMATGTLQVARVGVSRSRTGALGFLGHRPHGSRDAVRHCRAPQRVAAS
jgi:hypothetical protein